MALVYRLRFHGRGGEGVKQASRIVARALFLADFCVQDAPIYGAERRGAPVVAFVRFSAEPVRERGYVVEPDVVVVLDDSLLHHPDAAVLAGLAPSSLMLINSALPAAEIAREHGIAGRVVAHDVSSLALRILGRHVLSAPMAGLALKASGLVPWEGVARAVERELADAGLPRARIASNLDATREAFDAAPAVGFAARVLAAPPARTEPFVVPRLAARLAAPSVTAASTSALRTTEGWRVHRPVIDLSRCTRCLLCFALCPEGAIQLDAERHPVVDYAHCKGCLVCVRECPTKTIASVREEAA